MSVPGAVAYSGAKLRLADVDQGIHSSWAAIEAALTAQTRAVVIVHMRGFPCPDTVRIATECRARGLGLIEDCAQAWGATVDGRSVGTVGDYGVFSTQHYKLVVTGEGGVIVTRDPVAEDRLRWLSGRTSGMERSHPWPRNVRMPEVVAATGISQLVRLPDTVARLRALAEDVAACFKGRVGLSPHIPTAGTTSNGVSVPVWCDNLRLAERLALALQDAKVPAFRPGMRGDLHNALSWPVAAEEIEGLAGLSRLATYVDLPVPLLQRQARSRYISQIMSAIEGA
jgi:dTDP-4-amino-4,6-dideoxygalactose transaminase